MAGSKVKSSGGFVEDPAEQRGSTSKRPGQIDLRAGKCTANANIRLAENQQPDLETSSLDVADCGVQRLVGEIDIQPAKSEAHLGNWLLASDRRSVVLTGELPVEMGMAPFQSLAIEAFSNWFGPDDGLNVKTWLQRGAENELEVLCKARSKNRSASHLILKTLPDADRGDGSIAGEFLHSKSDVRSVDGDDFNRQASLAVFAPQILQTVPDPVMLYEVDVGWTFLNPAAHALLSKPPTVSGKSFDIAMPKGFRRMMLHMHERVISGGRSFRVEFYAKHNKLGLRWWAGLWAPLFDNSGNLSGVFVMHRDITEQTETQGELLRERKKLRVQATTDPLTKLHNRRSFFTNFSDLISAFAGKERTIAVILLDIDHFKSINDTYGHSIGDLVLRSISELLRSIVRPTDLLARWGGEEFIIAIAQTDEANVLEHAERLRAAVAASVIDCAKDTTADSLELRLTASFGVGLATAKDLQLASQQEQLINYADIALYQAKNDGRNCVRLHDSAIQVEKTNPKQP